MVLRSTTFHLHGSSRQRISDKSFTLPFTVICCDKIIPVEKLNSTTIKLNFLRNFSWVLYIREINKAKPINV